MLQPIQSTGDENQPATAQQISRNGFRPGWLALKIFGAMLVVVLILFLIPPVHRAREASSRTRCRNNLKQIGLALHNYHDVWNAFPPAYTVDASGHRLHSWRTLILPYMDQAELYRSIDLTRPWDDPANSAARTNRVPAYECPSHSSHDVHTAYQAVVGAKYAFRGSAPSSIAEFKDGSSNTVMIVEADLDRHVHWMEPTDNGENILLSLNQQTKTPHIHGLHVLLTDGSARFLTDQLSMEMRRALLTRNGGEQV